MKSPYFMFFKINLKTASLQNELQVCVLRKTMMFLSSLFVFHVF